MKRTSKDKRILGFGERVKTCREFLGLTIYELATRAKVTPAAISQIENGLREPMLSSALSLSEGLGTKLWKLLGEDKP